MAFVDDVARRVADALEAEGLPYALGGAFALSQWSSPRATIDVDVNVFLDAAELDRVLAGLRRAGLSVDEAEARRRALERGDLRAFSGNLRVDVFLAFDPIHDAIERRRVSLPFLGRPAWFLSGEDLLIFKMLFDRGKDWIDIEQLVATKAGRLDMDYIRSAFAQWVGPGDPRLARLEALVASYPPPPD